MASSVASTALTTEAHPLIPHAQGIRLGATSLNFANASGKGIPIKKASGAMSMIVNGILMIMAEAMKAEKTVGKDSIYSRPITAMPVTDSVMTCLEYFDCNNRPENPLPSPAKIRKAAKTSATA